MNKSGVRVGQRAWKMSGIKQKIFIVSKLRPVRELPAEHLLIWSTWTFRTVINSSDNWGPTTNQVHGGLYPLNALMCLKGGKQPLFLHRSGFR